MEQPTPRRQSDFRDNNDTQDHGATFQFGTSGKVFLPFKWYRSLRIDGLS
jgi:hypothetical protein